MKTAYPYISTLLFCLALTCAAGQLDKPALLPTESDYFKLVSIPIPEDIVLEGGGVVTLPDGDIAVSTRRGEVWIIENPYMKNGQYPNFRKFASGLHEILGLAYKDGSLYMAQRGELTRLEDTDGDGRADVFETVYQWPLSGHYHEYSYGPKIAPDGSFFVTGNVAFGNQEWWRGESRVPWRGWTMRITPEGEMEPWATGMRSPCGIGWVNGQFFYGDNQGDWMGSGFIMPVNKGDFTGHPAGLSWTGRPESPVKVTYNDIYYRVNPRLTPKGKDPVKPENIEDEIPTPLFKVAEEVPSVKTPAVWLPHGILGISTSEIITDETNGSFGPFAGQIFVGDQGQSKIDRVFLEQVKGVYQGAAFAFREGFRSGVLRMAWGKDGSLFVGQTNRGWGSTGNQPFALERVIWSGQMPFEMRAIRAMPDGFEIEFTQPVNKARAADPASYDITGFIYKYHPVYGSPIVNDEKCPVRYVEVSADGLKARLVVDNLRKKYVHEIKTPGITSYAGDLPLLHGTGYYTLNEIPDGEKLVVPEPEPEPEPVEEAPAMDHSNHKMPAVPAAGEADNPKKANNPTPAASASSSAKRVTKMPAGWGKPDITLSMSTLPGLKYDQTLVMVKAGSKVKFTFNNNDDMPHNIVFVDPGAADLVGKMALDLGLKGPSMNYVPNTPKVLHHSKLMLPGSSETLYFIAPDKPGDYMYVCSFPGHYLSMRGILRVMP